MKKYFILVVILLTSSITIAQKKVNKSQSKNRNTQEILARPPISIIDDPTDPIDPADPIDPIDPIDPVTTLSPPIETSEVGYTNGELSV